MLKNESLVNMILTI